MTDRRDNIKLRNILRLMRLAGQQESFAWSPARATSRLVCTVRTPANGYAMAALLVAMGVMAVMMTAAMPVWKQLSQREKETELVFRGEQYARAIGLFQRKAGPGVLPPNIDVLVQQKFLRRKYKDPITGQDFDLLTQTQAAPGGPGGAGGAAGVGRGQPPSSAGRGGGPQAPAPTGPVGTQPGVTPGAQQGGIVGVASKSKATSIRLYKGRNHYNEWQFIFVQRVQAPGAPGPGGVPQRGGPPQPGQQPPVGLPGMGGRGGRGSPPLGPSGPFGPGPFGGGGRGPTPPGPPVPGGGTPQPTPGN